MKLSETKSNFNNKKINQLRREYVWRTNLRESHKIRLNARSHFTTLSRTGGSPPPTPLRRGPLPLERGEKELKGIRGGIVYVLIYTMGNDQRGFVPTSVLPTVKVSHWNWFVVQLIFNLLFSRWYKSVYSVFIRRGSAGRSIKINEAFN